MTPEDPVVQAVRDALAELPPGAALVVATSGGADSTALLHACTQAWPAERLIACHVHHGLQAAADTFAEHCAAAAKRLGVRDELRRLSGQPSRGESVEAWARDHRYGALVACAHQSGAAAVLTAHHADDQAETLLIGLSRGSGLDGLSGMQGDTHREGVRLMRPFLSLSRASLADYCARHALDVIHDPMNDDPTLLRSALRARVMPVLSEVAPAFIANAARSAGLIAEAAELSEALAQIDLASARDAAGGLKASALAGLTRARQANSIRQWLRQCGAPVPSQARLSALLDQVFASQSPHALWLHAGWCVVRYRDRLQALSPQSRLRPDRPSPDLWCGHWAGEPMLAARDWGLELRIASAPAAGSVFLVDRALLEQGPIVLRAASARLRVRPGPRARSREVRKRWQELGVPPWLRGWLPEVLVGGVSVGVAGLGEVDRPAGQSAKEAGSIVAISVHAAAADDPRAGWVLPYN